MPKKSTKGLPSLAEMKMALAKKPDSSLQQTGANEAIGMKNKSFVSPDGEGVPIPIGGVDVNLMQPGQQLFQPLPPPGFQQPEQPHQDQQGQQQGQPGMPGQTQDQLLGNPEQLPQDQPPQPDQASGILNMTPQGHAINAMSNQPQPQPQQLAKGGKVKSKRGNKPVVIHKDLDTMKLELLKKKAKK